jgi:hypothetical protein
MRWTEPDPKFEPLGLNEVEVRRCVKGIGDDGLGIKDGVNKDLISGHPMCGA